MSLTWTSPAALWLLLALPLVWLAHVAGRTNFNTRQKAVQTAVRSLLLATLAVALARPVIATSSSRQSVVYIVDVSHSIAGRAIESAAARIDEWNGALRPAHSRIVVFGSTVSAVAGTADLRKLTSVASGGAPANGPDRSRTDLEAALLAGRGELAPEHVPRLVLFSDGHATAGDINAAVVRLAAERIPVSVEPMAVRSIDDTWIDSLEIPDRIAAGATFSAIVGVASQRERETAASIELKADDTVIASRAVRLGRGVTNIALDASLDTLGAHVLEARVSVPGDALAVNDAMARETWAEPRARVLYVEGTPASARYLASALTASGFEVVVRPPSALAASADQLEPYDVVVLSDVPRTALSDAGMAALSEWVEKRGGGLLVAGGEAIFGERGYRQTPIERLTPVTFERRDEPEVALVIVLDRSWSMAGSSMELTKAAAQAAVDVLTDEQSVGILTFNDKFAWDVPVRNVGKNRDSIRRKIAAIGPGGHTLIFPAVEQAYLALRNAKARAKHVILLSDGRSYPGEYESLVQKMVAANITLSSVAVGPSADPELLRNLARWGQGRAYVVADASQVPEIFVKEARSAITPGFDEKAIKPIVKSPGFLTGVDLARMPVLKGRTATVLKDDAMELLATDEDDPLLAFWPIGLGRTAVFASDVKDRWAANWVTWRGYGPFFTSIVRALQRQRVPPLALAVTPGPIRGRTRTVSIALEARDAGGAYRNLLNPTLQVRTRAGSAPARLPARQVAPGRYEASVVADAAQPLTVTVDGAAVGTGITSRSVLPDPAAEYRFRPTDAGLLRTIASATGGMYQPTATSLTNAPGDRRTERRPLWPALIVLALALWFADLVLRRIRIFEPGSDLDFPESTPDIAGSDDEQTESRAWDGTHRSAR
jgi:Ca-activated chloride channel family protein